MKKELFHTITEQGDLGLGAEVLGEKDQEVLNEQNDDKDTSKEEKPDK